MFYIYISMRLLELASCIPYALGHPRILGVSHDMKLKEKTKMFVKEISTEDFPKNCMGGTSNRSLRMRTMTVSESYPAIRLGGLSN